MKALHPRLYGVLILFCLFLGNSQTYAQESEPVQDSTYDPLFTPGTWVSGIDGTIFFSASSLPDDTLDLERGIGIVLSTQTGVFLKNKFNVGLRLELSSAQNGEETASSVRETLFIGPYFSKYFPGSGDWAIAPEIAVGYLARFTNFNSSDPDFNAGIEIRSKGVSTQLGSAFLFMFTPHLAFNIDTRINLGWLHSTKIGTVSGRSEDNIFIYNVAVVFGFRIFLDEFFF